MHLEHTIDIDASVDLVWDLTVDIEAWPTMTPTISAVRALDQGPLGVGSRALVKQPAQRAAVWTVTTFDPPRTFIWETTVMGLHMVGSHIVTPTQSGCRNTLAIDVSGRGSKFFGRCSVGGSVEQSPPRTRDSSGEPNR